MREITITQFHYEPDIKTFVGEKVAVIDLDTDGVHHVSGDEHYLEVPANDLASGEAVTVEQDPLRWAELIGETIGYGDIDVTVEEVAALSVGSASVAAGAAATNALADVVQR